MNLREILAISDPQERASRTKQAFSPLETPPIIDGVENEAICALVNLSEKISRNTDVQDRNKCKEFLRNEKWLKRAAKTYRFRTTHNLKFPDYRRVGTIRLYLKSNLDLTAYGWCSKSIPAQEIRHDWSQNSADINHAMFLCAEFILSGKLTCLGSELVAENKTLFGVLHQLGAHKAKLHRLIASLKEVPVASSLKDLSQASIQQLRFPVAESYVSLTPVLSTHLQFQMHNWLRKSYKWQWLHFCPRSSSVGRFAASVGGRVLVYQNRLFGLNSKHTWTPSSKELHWHEFNVLKHALKLQSAVMTSNRRTALKAQLRPEIDDVISRWLESSMPSGVETNSNERLAALNNYFSKNSRFKTLAYEPSITRLLKSRLAQVKSRQVATVSQNHTQHSVDYQYILLPGLQISHANGYASHYVTGIPSMIGIFGFVHAFLRNLLKTMEAESNSYSFAICLHKYALHRRGLTKEKYMGANGSIKTPGIEDTAHADYCLSLIVRLPRPTKLEEQNIFYSLPSTMCGGAVHTELINKGHFKRFECLPDAIKDIPYSFGRWIIPSNTIEKTNTFESWLDEASSDPRKAVSHIGYQMLESPTEKLGVLDNSKHAFVEPVLGMTDLISFQTNQQRTLFWQYSENGALLLVDSADKEKL